MQDKGDVALLWLTTTLHIPAFALVLMFLLKFQLHSLAIKVNFSDWNIEFTRCLDGWWDLTRSS